MRKSTKIITIVLACTVAVCCVIIGVGSVVNTDETTTTYQGDTTTAPAVNETQSSTTAPAETTKPATSDLSELIIGKWTDSVNMSGFEFFENGTVSFTYVNLESLNIPFSGTAENGVYTLEGNRLTVKYSIYTATIDKTYEISINGDVLSMKDLEEFETLTYKRAKAEDTTQGTTAGTQATTEGKSVGDELVGSWINADSSIKYKFKADGNVTVSLSNVVLPTVGTAPVSGSYNGVYLTDDNKVTIQYTVNSAQITEKYSFAVTKNSIKLTDQTGNTINLVREGTSFTPANEDDLLGVWRDGANMSGYEFKENGIVKITYVNFTIPVVNIPLNGTFPGGYEVNGNELTVSFSIYGNTISDTYTYEINGNVLTLTNKSNNNVSTYMKK